MRLCRNAGSCRCRRAAFKASINIVIRMSPITRKRPRRAGLYRVCGPTVVRRGAWTGRRAPTARSARVRGLSARIQKGSVASSGITLKSIRSASSDVTQDDRRHQSTLVLLCQSVCLSTYFRLLCGWADKNRIGSCPRSAPRSGVLGCLYIIIY